ncbi:uncharacterized protein LOC106642169 [Copidosoma floridanum]|uniref:uncharacterized protein LOC106642169 n=1 Tax=Copidosoma floridanum TaxID=29053 RepID=UPI0006C9568A|nr:uncharacterized protein LOC106642169 [Copidosoma floridanum]
MVILSILNFKHGFRLCSAGEPGYLDFDNLPETNFSCRGKVIGGYYADVEAGCQMFHVCTTGQKDEIMDIKFLCLNGTVFDQETRVCERVDEVDCSKSEQFYFLNLELYGSHAVTLSGNEEEEEERDENEDDGSTEPRSDHQQQQHMTSVIPSTSSSTTTTTPQPNQPSTTSANNIYQSNSAGYSQHYQPRPAFPAVQTSQSNTHYDDKNGGYHHQYIFHSDERSNNNNNQATSYQLFSNQGVSSTTPTPQVHQQVRYTSNANTQVIHSEPSTVTPLQYHVQSTSSTIQTLLNSNANNPSLINPLFHNHGISSTTEQFNVHNNSPREISEYQDNSEDEREEQVERKALEPAQSTNQGKNSKLKISPVPQQEKNPSIIQTKSSGQTSQQQRISINYLPTPNSIQLTINAFYPTQRPTSQNPQKSSNNQQITQHIHVPPPPAIPQLKPQQITINLPPPDIQRIVQNPSPLLPSQSRVIVTAKASVSDESGRPLNVSQLITLPIPTIPSNYDEYKEGDESFDPFYRDVPKIRNDQRIVISRKVGTEGRNLRKKRSADVEIGKENPSSEEIIFNAEIKDIKDLKANLPIIKAILFGLPIPENSNSTFTSENKNNSIKNIDELTVEKETVANTEISVPVKNEDSRFPIINAHSRPIIARQNLNRVLRRNTTHQAASKLKVNEDIPTDAEPKDTVQLFLSAVDGNNSLINNSDFTHQRNQLSHSNEAINPNNVLDNRGREFIHTRSSLNSNTSNRKRYRNDDSLEVFQRYFPRRNIRIQAKPYKYYEDYDASESVELGTRQRSNRLRQRPKERRIYRDDYIDSEDVIEDVVEDGDYDDEIINFNRKGTIRRGPQGRRVLSRSRNRYYDYEDDIEAFGKSRYRTNNPVSGRNRIKIPSELPQSRRRRPELERRRNGRRRPLSRSQPNTNAFNEPTDRDISDDYVDYADLRHHITRNGYANRRNRNRFDTRLELIPRRDSNRRDKSRKFVEQDQDEIEITSKIEDLKSYSENDKPTAIPDDENLRTTNIPTEYTIPDDVSTEDYDEYGIENTTLKVDNIESTDSQEDIKTTTEYVNTEGILKFTDELPLIDKKNDQEEKQEIIIKSGHSETSTTNIEDYIDDNYEPESYIGPEIEQKIKEENEEDSNIHTTKVNHTEGIRNTNVDTSPIRAADKQEYDEVYEEKFETTTAALSEEYYDSDVTLDVTLPPTTLNPIPKPTTLTTTTTTSATTTTTPLAITYIDTFITSSTSSVPNTSSTARSKTTTKFVKPTAFRKNYIYNPTITTPNPVVIRRGQPLGGPKPTKSPPTYNELAPKPVIRRLPLLSRTTTTTSESSILDENSKIEEDVYRSNDEISSISSTESKRNPIVNPVSIDLTTVPTVATKIGNKATTKDTKIDLVTENINNQIPLEETTTLAAIVENEKIFDNEVRKQSSDSYDAYYVPKKLEDSVVDTTKADIELSTLSPDSLVDETTKSKDDSSHKVFKAQKTTVRTSQSSPTIRPSQRRKLELTTVRTQNQKTSQSPKQVPGFNCLEKEMYSFYGDVRDCRLFHYCSRGFTARQVLDFRFVCEEGTIFDEESQSCRHDVQNPKCIKRTW